MMEFFGSVWWLLVTLGLLVTFHEFGHFWVARRCGVRVLRFSVGFGTPLLRRHGRDGTEYVLAALPLGGYVKFLDEREVEVAAHERHQSFNAKSVWQRIAIVAAGPLANLLLCVAVLWLMFVIGKPDLLPEVGAARGIAADAGFAPGDRLLAVDGRRTATWTEAGIALAIAAMDREPVAIRVRRADGTEATLTIPFGRDGVVVREERALQDLGLRPAQWSPDTLVGAVSDGAAAPGGLLAGDVVLAVEGEPVAVFEDIGGKVAEVAREGQLLTVRVRRGDRELDVRIDPTLRVADGERRWILGIRQGWVPPQPDTLLRHSPLAAVPAALGETAAMASTTVGIIHRLIVGKASLSNVSGPVTIARVANATANHSVVEYLQFLAALSLSLCIMNLLPIPVLDGGHLLYYLIELVKGSPVGERVLAAGQYVGLAFLACLMGLAFYNDLFRPGF